jgi:methylated-DNA-protein-cysteine methyltransferase-like protein
VGDGAAPERFDVAVAAVVRALGPGEVVTYGEVAAEAGRPGAARAVGGVLAAGGGALPWWRVVTASGRLVPGHEFEHARLLAAEGVDVTAGRVRRTVPSGRLTEESGPGGTTRPGVRFEPGVAGRTPRPDDLTP